LRVFPRHATERHADMGRGIKKARRWAGLKKGGCCARYMPSSSGSAREIDGT
jgi:hypothetical protein